MLLLTNVISSRKYASKMFPSVRLEGLEQQCTAIPSNFNEECEGIESGLEWAERIMWKKA